MSRLRFTVLGCGASPGAPWINGYWGVCDPNEPRNRRSRCALMVERFGADGITRVLIDSGPDIRSQLLSVGAKVLDGVVYTHAHADHVHGIDDLRALVMASGEMVDVYSDDATQERLSKAFDYCFQSQPESGYPPILRRNRIVAGERFRVTGPGGAIEFLPFRQIHGRIDSLGFRIADLAYSSDLNDVPRESVPALDRLSVWIVDALRRQPHLSHFGVDQALEWIARVKPKRAFLTHMTVELDYATLKATLPQGVEPAYDGLVIELDD